MNTKPHVSQEADRLAYQAQQNIINLARYRHQRDQLEALKMNLSRTVMNTNPQATCQRLEAVIKSGHRKLEQGVGLVEAVKHCYSLLEESLA